MFRKILSALVVVAAVIGPSTSVNAQEMEGSYESTNMNGTPILAGFTIIIEVTHVYNEPFPWGKQYYETQAKIVVTATGQVVKIAPPGLLEVQWGVGSLVGNGGIQGILYPDGTGSYVADYSAVGGNTRLWTPQ
tara:strand:+ start:310 stop:711 length:402 start_codon:yes stop_codon:yes gene_type:complete